MITILSVSKLAFAGSCAEYPYTVGGAPEFIDEQHYKFLFTSSVAVNFDDITAINEAREEATMEAKAGIAKLMSETIKSDAAINKIIGDQVTLQGEQKTAQRKEAKESLKKLVNNTQALLRGVIPLGDCYTKGEEMRVTVGIKPESILQAEKIAGSISNSVNAVPAPKTSDTKAASPSSATTGSSIGNGVVQPLKGSDGFSNTERLRNF